MREHPIIFTAESVRAILDGRKTMTRRIVNPQPKADCPEYYADRYNHGNEWCFWLPDNRMSEPRTWKCPYGIPGDRLWVREPWCTIGDINRRDHLGFYVRYKADESKAVGAYGCIKWRSPIHMPRWASRITLEISDVRVERLQEISEKDSLSEGVQIPVDSDMRPLLNVGLHPKPNCKLWNDPKSATATDYIIGYFAALWNSINLKRAPWDSNPWVWVIGFRRLF